jgi:hypothetical protein
MRVYQDQFLRVFLEVLLLDRFVFLFLRAINTPVDIGDPYNFII